MRRNQLVLTLSAMIFAMGFSAAAERDAVKDACDNAANWLIEQHDVKTGLFGKEEKSEMPGVVAVVLQGLCESPRKYRETIGPFVSEPVAYLLKHQRADGSIALPNSGRENYSTALAVLALQATANPEHLEAIRKAQAYLLSSQQKDGGFSYSGKDPNDSDLSNTWLAVAALHAARDESSGAALKKAISFIQRCQDHPETNPDLEGGPGSGGAYYKPGHSEFGAVKTRDGKEVPKPYASMTAAALQGFLLCGLKPDAPEVQAALKWLTQAAAPGENKGGGQKGYYYFAMAFARAMASSGAKEITLADGKKLHWAQALADELLKRQRPEGFFVNSEAQWMEDNPILCTGYALQALNLCYKALK